MKKLLFIILLFLTGFLSAQTSVIQTEKAISDSSSSSKWDFTLGLAAGGTVFIADASSPYFSRFGTTLQVPFSFNYRFNPHWRLSLGLRYDFNWALLSNCVDIQYDNLNTRGIAIDTTPHVGHQRANAFHNYIGIPVQVTWYPWNRDRTLLSLSLDFYAGYAISKDICVRKNGSKSWLNNHHDTSDPSLVPWKMELGFTVSTDIIGIIHGVRIFTNLLPTYKDPKTNKNIYTAGITFFL